MPPHLRRRRVRSLRTGPPLETFPAPGREHHRYWVQVVSPAGRDGRSEYRTRQSVSRPDRQLRRLEAYEPCTVRSYFVKRSRPLLCWSIPKEIHMHDWVEAQVSVDLDAIAGSKNCVYGPEIG